MPIRGLYVGFLFVRMIFVGVVSDTGMSRYPRRARSARVKCIKCNAPATETIDDGFVCVECGTEVLSGYSSSETETQPSDD